MTEKRYYMACLDLAGRRCLVIGDGDTAAEKAHGLSECEAEVVAVAPDDYEPAQLDGCYLLLVATTDAALSERVYQEAEARALLCNVADVPTLSSFILPAIHRQDPIAIAVTTGGASPALAQRIRSEIAERYGQEHAELARSLRAIRPWVKARFPTYEERRDFLHDLVERALA